MTDVMRGGGGGLHSAVRASLTPVSAAYAASSALRNLLYDTGLLWPDRADVPVISVGNLTVGGTGKSPAAVLIAGILRDLGKKPGIASRGYAAQGGMLNDENTMISEALPYVPIAQARNRAAAVRMLVAKHGVDCAVLDDGFQHRQLGRDYDILLVDATAHEGWMRHLPSGMLRERFGSAARASLVVLSNADFAPPAAVERLTLRLRAAGYKDDILMSALVPKGVLGPGGRDPAWFSGRKIHLMSGIGNPGSFRSTAESLGAEITGDTSFPDHHRYSAADLSAVSDAAAAEGSAAVLTTAKDWVKVRGMVPDRPPPFNALEIEMRILEGRGVLAEKIRGVFAEKGSSLKTF